MYSIFCRDALKFMTKDKRNCLASIVVQGAIISNDFLLLFGHSGVKTGRVFPYRKLKKGVCRYVKSIG